MSFSAYGASFRRVAAADADGNARADVITSAGPHVKVFSGAMPSALSSFRAGSPAAGAVFVAGGR